MLTVGLLATYMVLRLIRICPALWASPDTSDFFKLFAINFIANTDRKNPRKIFWEFEVTKLQFLTYPSEHPLTSAKVLHSKHYEQNPLYHPQRHARRVSSLQNHELCSVQTHRLPPSCHTKGHQAPAPAEAAQEQDRTNTGAESLQGHTCTLAAQRD